MPTLLIADDHPLFREALRGAVTRVIPGVQLAGWATIAIFLLGCVLVDRC